MTTITWSSLWCTTGIPVWTYSRSVQCACHLRQSTVASALIHAVTPLKTLVPSGSHLRKVIFTTAVKKKNVLNDHFHCSHQYPVSGWVMAVRCCMRLCFLRTATSAYAIKPLNLHSSIVLLWTRWENEKQKHRSKTTGKGNRVVSKQERRFKMTSWLLWN